MSGIEELRQRVVDAEERFGVINQQQAKYSARLISLMNAVEGRILEQQDEIGQQTAAIERGSQENEQLRAMLHSLLKAIEAGSRDVLADAMQQLDQKASALVGEQPSEPEATPEPEPEPVLEIEAETDAPAETASEDGSGEDGSGEDGSGGDIFAEPDAAAPAINGGEEEAAMTPQYEDVAPEVIAAEAEVEEPLPAGIDIPGTDIPGTDITGEEGDSTPPYEDVAPEVITAEAEAEIEMEAETEANPMESGSLTDIMDRVSKLVEESGEDFGMDAGENQQPETAESEEASGDTGDDSGDDAGAGEEKTAAAS